jgi:hypothetical protein
MEVVKYGVRDEASKSEEGNEESQTKEKEVAGGMSEWKGETFAFFYLTKERILGMRSFCTVFFPVMFLKYDERR